MTDLIRFGGRPAGRAARAARRVGVGLCLGAGLVASAAPAHDRGRAPGLWPLAVEAADLVYYDGVSDDLLTAGLGADGLAGATPAVTSPPTAAELRRLAIYNNYRALIDVAPGGGYGELYGPNIDAAGSDTGGQGMIAGHEALVYAKRGEGRRNVTIMIQAPDSFDPARPCVVAAASSGSRGVYGAIGTAGEWGLKNGCVVAYTDKGTGTGAHDLSQDLVSLITGERVPAGEAGSEANFSAPLSDAKRAAYAAEFPDRLAFKHAHSRLNPEADWGRDVLDAIRVAFSVMNLLHDHPGDPAAMSRLKGDGFGRHGWGGRFTPWNTIVIASSVSNGAGSSVRAAEIDRFGLIDGVAVSEPNVNPRYDPRFVIIQGDGPPLRKHSRSLYDYTTLLNVYQGCASASPDLATAPLNFAPSAGACASLADLGLLSASTLEEQAAEAQAIINGYGVLEEQNALQPSHWFANVPQSISMTYANAYGRFGVEDNLCGYSLGATDATTGGVVPLPTAAQEILFSASNGIPPTAGVSLVNNTVGGGLEYRVSTPDQYLDGALCLRGLAMRRDPVSGHRLGWPEGFDALRIARGVGEIRASGDLDGRPAVIVTGRNDAILPPNHTSRAYYGLNQMVERRKSDLHYYEVLNAHHLDAFNGLAFAGFPDRYVPLHHYFVQIHDMLLAHLREGAPLAPSQVVRTIPRGLSDDPDLLANPISLANLPPISLAPAEADKIVFRHRALMIPD